MDGGSERKLAEMLVKPNNPEQEAAEARARNIIERAQLNEVIRIIDELTAEVEQMKIADRFKRDKKPDKILDIGHAYAGEVHSSSLKNLNEPEHKRQALLNALRALKDKTYREIIAEIEKIVIDIEATKTEG